MTEFDRDEAVALARGMLQRVRSRYVKPELEAVEDYRLSLRNDRHGYQSTEGMLSLQRLSESDQLDSAAHDAIAWYAVAFLREERQPPPWLANFIDDVLMGERIRPREDGRKNRTNPTRDGALYYAVELLHYKYGLQRQANPTGDPEDAVTACTLVAEAARGEGYDIGSDAVRKACERYRVHKSMV